MRLSFAGIRKILPIPILVLALITMGLRGGGGFPSNPFFPTGAVLDFGAGNMTLTHATGTLTLAGGQLLLPDSTILGLSGADATTGIKHSGAFRVIISGGEYLTVTSNLLQLPNANDFTWASEDLFLTREGAGTFQQGKDAAAPVAQTFKGPDARAGTDTNTVGGALKQAGGRPTGTGLPGIVGLQGSLLSTTTGTAASALIDRFIANAAKVLTDASATAIVNATIANGSAIGGIISYTIEATDGTDYQAESGQAIYSSQNKAGTISGTITEINSQQNLSAGTLATTWAISNANPAVISINADTSLVPSTGYPRITFSIQNFGQQAIAIQ